jgi:hypothetical protein
MLMVNGITWEEETVARIREAKEKQQKAEATIKQAEIEARHWGEYADVLQKALELARQRDGHKLFDSERLLKQSTWENLVDIMSTKKGLLVVVDAVTILVEGKVFSDREHARNVIYSTLYSHKRDIQKVRRGVYRLREVRLEKQRRVKKARIIGLRQAILDLKTANPEMTKQDVLHALRDKHFDFQGKSPKMVIHMAWLNMGYAKKESQQLPMGFTSSDIGGVYVECPSCHRYKEIPRNVARHIMAVFDEPHTEWLEAQGFNPLELVGIGGKGDYKPLIEYLEKMHKAEAQ